jgi:hypothetical protein
MHTKYQVKSLIIIVKFGTACNLNLHFNRHTIFYLRVFENRVLRRILSTEERLNDGRLEKTAQ